MATVSCHLPILYFELELNFWYFSMYGSWRTFLPAHCPVASVKVHTWGKFIRITWLTMPVLLNSSINFRLLSAANISVLKKLSSQTPPVLNHLHTHGSPSRSPLVYVPFDTQRKLPSAKGFSRLWLVKEAEKALFSRAVGARCFVGAEGCPPPCTQAEHREVPTPLLHWFLENDAFGRLRWHVVQHRFTIEWMCRIDLDSAVQMDKRAQYHSPGSADGKLALNCAKDEK